MFLRRSLASLARAVYVHICVGTFGGLAPPPPPYQKAGYALGKHYIDIAFVEVKYNT